MRESLVVLFLAQGLSGKGISKGKRKMCNTDIWRCLKEHRKDWTGQMNCDI